MASLGQVVVAGWGGLSLYENNVLRKSNTWTQLDNFDLVVDGSIRKILPPVNVAGPFPNVLWQLLEYRSSINQLGGFLRDIAVDANGNLYSVFDSTTAWNSDFTSIVTSPITDIPFLGQMQGYYIPFNVRTWQASTAYAVNDAVYRYSAVDGNLYVYYVSVIAGSGTSGTTEPIWPATQGSTVVDHAGANQITWKNAGILNSQRFKLNYGIFVAHTYPAMKFVEWKYDPTNGAEAYKVKGTRIGVSQPLDPINVTPSVITPNINGYSPNTGRAYVWTYYNPNTLHDSSPSPFVGPTKITTLDVTTITLPTGLVLTTTIGKQFQLPGSILPPLPVPAKGFQSYQSAYLEIPVTALTPTYGDGYTHIRCWATIDGGSSFFLLTQMYDNNGNLISNGDGSIPVAVLSALSIANSWTGYVPLPTAQQVVATVRIWDGSTAPVNLAPDPQNLGSEAWNQVGTLFVVTPGVSPQGQAGFLYNGTGGASGTGKYNSSAILVTNGASYTFQGYIDDTSGTGGTLAWRIMNGGTGAIIATYSQTGGVAGNVGGTFTAPASKKIIIQAYITGVTVATDNSVFLSDPLLQAGGSISTVPVFYPTPDASLVFPAPVALSQQPPPSHCLAGAIFENCLFLVDHDDPSRLVYSNPGDPNSYGVNSFIQFPTDRSFSIMELVPGYDRMLVSGPRSVEQVFSNSPSAGFARFPFDPQHGSLSYRGSIAYGSRVFMLMDAGIAMLSLGAKISAGGGISTGFTPEAIISRPIKPLLDNIDPTTIHLDSEVAGQPTPVVDNKQDLYLLGYRNVEADTDAYMDALVMMPLRGQDQGQFSHSSTHTLNIGVFANMREVQIPSTRNYGVLVLAADKNVYQMFAGTQDGTVTATAVTQLLPTVNDIKPELWDTQKVFQDVILEGVDLPNFQVTALDEAGNSYPLVAQLVAGQHTLHLGIAARQIQLKFVHSAATANVPQLSFMKLTYSIEGVSP